MIEIPLKRGRDKKVSDCAGRAASVSGAGFSLNRNVQRFRGGIVLKAH